MTMRHLFAILMLLAVIPLAHAGGKKAPPQSPAARTRVLLDTHGHEMAVQEIKQIDKMRTVLSKGLYPALRATRIAQDAPVEANSGDKPAQLEIGFHSGIEHDFDSYAVGLTNSPAKNRAAVDVEFVQTIEGKPLHWKDRYEWVLEGSTWKLDDIVYRIDLPPSRRERRLKPLLKPASKPTKAVSRPR